MTSSEIRNSFLKFFEERGHTIISSSPVVPYDDPTLLFANAGMNQFKDVFLGNGKRAYKRAADTQKCIRVSGKHNDLEEVGRDTYHHTFFEMLGNWSFGDYYKKEAVTWAWELLTKIWELPKNRLWATVYKDDQESEQLWKTLTDIDPSHVLRFGEKDNFWEMGETGPCGPCSEIHIDRTPACNATAEMVNAGLPEVMEIWNLVFIQYNRDETGKLTPLPAKHVDTGMGFERVCAVLQNKNSNYDTDVFTPIINKISEITKQPYDGNIQTAIDNLPDKNNRDAQNAQSEIDTSMRVIADHVRTLTFAIGDGATPSNEGRGYVLRRILRRAARFGRNLGMHEPFIYQLVPTLVESMCYIFPEIKANQEHIQKVIKGEEESFNATLDNGLKIFEELITKSKTQTLKTISGTDAFKLYDTFGFPLDLTELMVNEHGLKVDVDEFNKLMEEQKERSRESKKFKWIGGPTVAYWLDEKQDASFKNIVESKLKDAKFEYDKFEIETRILESPLYYTPDNPESKFKLFLSGLILGKTTFYVESGGQVSDTGCLEINFGDKHIDLEILSLDRRYEKTVHIVDIDKRDSHHILDQYISVKTKVDIPRRLSIMRNHSATHLLHNALRRILGTHVHQAGSLVAPDYLRFDFAHFAKLSEQEIADIEALVNEKIKENILRTPGLNNIPFEDAKKMGALMFFGDKYGDFVNVIQFGDFSTEFCGGTHVNSTGEIGYFKIRSEGSVASGVRRIEAVTGNYAVELLKEQEQDFYSRLHSSITQSNELAEYYSAIIHMNGTPSIQIKDIVELEGNLNKLKQLPPVQTKASSFLAKSFIILHENEKKLSELNLQVLEARKSLEKEIAKVRLQSHSGSIDALVASAKEMDGIKIVASKVTASTADELKSLGDSLRSKLSSGVGLLACVIEDKVQLVCVVTDDLVATKKIEAGKVVGAIAKLVGGGGGGRPHMATAGGKDVAKLDDALAQTKSIVESLLRK